MELIALADIKQYLKLTSNTHDSLLSAMIQRASAYIETICNRNFNDDQFTELYTGENSSQLILDNSPVIDVEFVSNDLDTDAKQYGSVIEPNEILVNCKTGIIEWMNGVFSATQRAYLVRYRAGYLSIPDDIQMVCADLVAKKFQDIDEKRIGIASKTNMSDNVSFSFLDISKENMNILKRYTKKSRRVGITAVGWGGAS